MRRPEGNPSKVRESDWLSEGWINCRGRAAFAANLFRQVRSDAKRVSAVWHFLNSDTGGVARFVEQLVAAQARLSQPPAALIRVTAPAGLRLPASVRLTPYAVERKIWGLTQWRFAAFSWWQIRGQSRSDPALVHTHSFSFAGADVHTVHGFYHAYWNKGAGQADERAPRRNPVQQAQYRMLSRLERRMLTTAKEVVFTSTDNRDYAETVLNIRRPDHCHVILPGVDPIQYHPGRRRDLFGERRTHFPELEAKRRWLLFAGHNYVGKGLIRLLKALAKLGPSADWLLLVFGDDPLNLGAAQAAANQIGADRVRIMGADKRLALAFGLGDLFVMDSVSEGFPLVLLEAMASGCVPAVSRFGGVSDVVEDGVNGFVLKSADEIVSTAISVDARRLREMSACSAKMGSARTWDVVAKEYANLYELARRPRDA
jgi:glycosyltransferase involved in cell wall biosynthesis